MAKKTNLITLRKHNKTFNSFLSLNIFIKNIILFKKYLKKFFKQNNIYLIKTKLNINSSKMFIYSALFFKTIRILRIKQKIKKKYIQTIRKKQKKNYLKILQHKNKNFEKKLFKLINFLKINSFIFKFKNLNIYKYKRHFSFKKFLNLFKKMGQILFFKRFFFLIDCIKVSIFFNANKINTNFFITILSDIFKKLQKRKHARYIFFLKELFKIFTITNKKQTIYGIKLNIAGKLRGKPRSSTCSLLMGQIPTQSFFKKIEYSESSAFTRYGTFGFKMWTYRAI